MKTKDIIDAWKSHDTLFRQSDGKFNNIIEEISNLMTAKEYNVPYFTRIWFSNLSST